MPNLKWCRNCGKSLDINAFACLACGLAPLNGNQFCNSCGAETNPAAIICVKCGCGLPAKNAFNFLHSNDVMVQPPVSPKDPAFMFVLSFLFVGLGQIVLGQRTKGVLMFLSACTLLWMICENGLMMSPIFWTSQNGIYLVKDGGFFLLMYPLFWLFSALDAYKIATKLKQGNPVAPFELFMIPINDSAKNVLKSNETKEKVEFVKQQWAKSSPKVKFLLAGGIGLLALLFLIFIFGWLFGKSSLPYARAVNTINSKREKQGEIFKTKYGADEGKITREESSAAWDKLKKEADGLFASVKPPPIELDSSCQDIIKDVQLSAPTLDSLGIFGLYGAFQIKYTAKSDLKKYGETKLHVKVYSLDGTLLKELEIKQNENALENEKVSARFSVDFSELNKIATFKVFKSAAPPTIRIINNKKADPNSY